MAKKKSEKSEQSIMSSIAGGAYSITSVSTSIALFVGHSDSGKTWEDPVLFLADGGIDSCKRSIETRLGHGEMADQVCAFFQNGGSMAYVMHISGPDSFTPRRTDYLDAYKVIRRRIDMFNILVLPRSADQTDGQMADIYKDASHFCKTQKAILIADAPIAWRCPENLLSGNHPITELRDGMECDHVGIYWPRLRVSPGYGLDNMSKVIGPCGSVAGLMARTDVNRGVWKAPAGLDAEIRGAQGLERSVSNHENGLFNQEAVNVIRSFPSGVVVWGARTMAGYDYNGQRDCDYKYIPTRRLALMIEESLQRGLQFTEFESNDEGLWAEIRRAAGAFMHNLFRQGAFKGEKASDAYFVNVDCGTTTERDIELGLVNIVVGFAHLKPADFIVIKIQQKAGRSSVS